MSDTQARLDFVLGLDRLKAVERRSRPVGQPRQENSAEHSWHAALSALSLAGECTFPVDAQHAALLLLMHDVPEIINGDIIAYSDAHDSAVEDERRALHCLLAGLPGADATPLTALWEEFEARQTPESRYANAIDRLLPVMLNIATRGESWIANGIRLQQVIERNAVVGEVMPAVWARVRPQIENVFREHIIGAQP